MRHQFQQAFRLSFVRIIIAAALLVAVLPDRVMAQQDDTPVSPTSFAVPQSSPNAKPSGTANYIPVWTGPKTAGNSIMYQANGDSIGVGTTTPAATLDVNGGINTSTVYNLAGTAFAFGSTSAGNAFLGFAGNATTTGGSNTASGFDALKFNSTGKHNTASGFAALESNTTGGSNTASGVGALAGNTTGNGNTASGLNALYFNNASYNTASGYAALESNTTGTDNTASGAEALLYNTTGSNNIAIGVNAALNVSAENSSNIEIGSEGSSGDSGAIRIGTSPNQSSFFAAGVSGVTTGLNDAVPVLIDSNGQLGTVSSSRRFKEDIQDMGNASEGLMRLRPVTFRYKKLFDDGSKPIQYGLIAEEVAEVYPDLVARSGDGQIETVKYQLLDPMLLNEVQRQQKEMQAQQTEIRDQKALVLTQQGQLKAQRAQLKTQQAQIAELASQVKTIQASLRVRRATRNAKLASAPIHAEAKPAPATADAGLQAGSSSRGGS